MRAIIKKFFICLLSFVMVVTSTPSYIFAKTEASVGKSQKKETVVEELFTPYVLSAPALSEPATGWKDLDWLKGYYQSESLSIDNWDASSIVVPNDKALIMLSHVDPAEYYNKKIVINPSGGNPTFNIASETTVSYGNDLYSFHGLCSDENFPYQGTLSVAGAMFMTDTPLFGCLSDHAKVTSTLKFTYRYHTTRPLLAEMIVHQEEVTSASAWALEVNTEKTQTEIADNIQLEPEYHIGSLIGTLGQGAMMDLSFINNAGDGKGEDILEPKLSFTVNEAGGLFAGSMETKSVLSVTYSEDNPSPVIGNVTGFSTSDDGTTVTTGTGAESNVGALVGSMAEGSKLVLKESEKFAFSGSVSAAKGNAGGLVGSMAEESKIQLSDSLTVLHNVSVTNGNAGGLVGYMDGGSIALGSGKTVSVKDNTITGSGHIGGLFGYYATKNAITYDDTYKVSGVKLSGGGNAGGLFGVLRNVKTDAMTTGIQIEITNPAVTTTYSGGNGTYGGLLGCYKADDRSAALSIHDATVRSALGGNASCYGGAIGRVANQIDDDVTGYSYIEMEKLTMSETNNSEVKKAYGGVIGEVEKGHLINLGNVKVTTSDRINGNPSGGVIGEMQEASVLRLHGTTDLSAIQDMKESDKSGQLVGVRVRALIYAVGSGSDEVTTGDYWRFLRMTQRKYISDVGSYGEVLRLDGSKLKEKKLAADEAASGSFEDDEIIRFSPSLHQVVLYQADPANIATPRDFAALSLYIQQEGKNGGCFSFAGTIASLSMDGSSVSGSSITITADIDMSGTGIMGLMRSNDSRYYTGTFDGGGHTLTLTTGELYGMISGSDHLSSVKESQYESVLSNRKETYRGCGEIYRQPYLGLFTQLQNATVQNLTIDGYLHFDTKSTVYAGVLAGCADGAVSINNVKVSSNVVYGGDNSTGVYASACLGYVNEGAEIVFQNCSLFGDIKNYQTVKSSPVSSSNVFNGGFIAFANRSKDAESNRVTVLISSCAAIGCTILDDVYRENTRDGVLVGQTANYSTPNYPNVFSVNGLTLDGVTVSSNASNRAAGLLAHEMNGTNFDVTGLSIKDCSLTCADKKAIFGGLATKATGYWKVHKSEDFTYGIQFSGSNSFSGKSEQTTGSTGSTSGLLVACGQDKDNTQAIYLEVGEGAYVIDGSVSLDLSSDYFDEFVGNTINFSQNGVNGIVSIATTGGMGLDQTAAYVNRTSSSWQNDATRYYYNLDTLRFEDGTQTVRDLSRGIDCGKDLLCWSVADYAASNIDPYFNSGSGLGENIQGTIDLTGLSFYPLETKTYLNFKADTTITFGYEAIQSINKNYIPLDDSKHQHYMMQYGLYRDIVVNNQTLTEEVEVKDLTLQGTVGYDSTYCGALICGNVTGRYDSDSSTIYSVALKVSNVTLDGIRLTGFTNAAGYAPLLIRSIGEYTDLTINGLQTTDKYSNEAHDQTPKVATSLIGNVGSETAKVVNLTFANLALDGRKPSGSEKGIYYDAYGTCNSIFTKAILLHSFQYISGSGQYNFASTEAPRITYGKEISNSDSTEEGAVSGRNNNLQFNYYDGGEVQNPWGDNTDSLSMRFAQDFLPYVYWGEEKDAAGKQVSTSHELDINLKVDFFENGCGTYSDPYIVEDGMQLERLAAYINDGTKLNGMKVQVDIGQLKNQMGTLVTDATGHNHVTYSVEGGEWKPVDASTETISNLEDKIRSYLRNAYYMITEDITLGISGSYYGIGNATVADTVEQGKTFSGVIVGKKEDGTYPVITMKAPKKAGTVFAGLISCANGCVVKNLVLDYSGTQIVINGSESKNTNSLGNVSFFGGVIGRVLGGDNIIDNVTVKYSSDSVQVTESAGTSNYAYLAAVGGYVGMVGWDYRGGGGVIFRNMPKNSYLKKVTIAGQESYDIGVYVEKEYKDSNRFFYANPYVGRVTDAYVCYEKTSLDSNVLDTLNNTDKNYMIPTLSAVDKLSVGQWYDSIANSIHVKVEGPQQLWILSAIVNSGATAMNCNTYSPTQDYFYGKSNSTTDATQGVLAYNAGKVRYATYDTVGQAINNMPKEELWWSGIHVSDTGSAQFTRNKEKVSYLVEKYTSLDVNNQNTTQDDYNTFPAAHLTGNNARVEMEITADCDMTTSYGNGFRGIGASYNTYANVNVYNRHIALQDFNANNCTVKLQMTDHEYYEEGDDKDQNNTLRCVSSALFPMIYLMTETKDKGCGNDGKSNPRVFKDVIISGTVTKDYNKLDGTKSYIKLNDRKDTLVPSSNEEIFTGGLIGTIKYNDTSNQKGDTYLSLQNIDLKDLTIKGGYDSGGIITYMVANTSKYLQFLNCDIQNLVIEGGVCCGGYIGAYNGTYKGIAINTKFDGTVMNDRPQTIVSASSFSDCYLKGETCEGGFIGYCSGKNYVKNVLVSSSSFGVSTVGGSTTIATGGLTGIHSGGKFDAESIVISDCSFEGRNTNNSANALGGMVGYLKNTGSFRNCSIIGNSTNSITMKNSYNIGGFIGRNTNNLIIENCPVSGSAINSIVMENATNMGGMIGYINTSSSTDISSCWITGEVEESIVMTNASNLGGIVGYKSSTGTTTITSCQIGGTIPNCIVMDDSSKSNPNIGGIIGQNYIDKNYDVSQAKISIKASNTPVQNVLVVAADGSQGGVCGYVAQGSPLFSSLEIDGITLLGGKAVGGMIGKSSTENIGISNSVVKNSKLVTTTENQNYRPDSGSVGVLLGAGSGALKGYNILSRDNLCGYQLKEGQPDSNSSASRYDTLVISDSITTQRTVDSTVSLDQARALSAATIGLKDVGPYSYANQAVKQVVGNESINYTDMRVFIPYADLEKTGVADASSEAPYRFTAGNIGCWVGYIESNIDELKLVGISKKGDYLPNADVGYCESTGGTFVYGDYSDSVFAKDDVAEGEVIPYITTNPVSEVLKDLSTTADGSTRLSLTGDAAVFADKEQKKSMAQQILSDYKEKGANQWNKIYGSVDGAVYEAFDVGGKYKDKLTDYQTAEAYEASKAGCETFPILVVDTMDSDVITEIINDYVSVVTNTTQTKASHSYTTINVTTYRWETDHFTCYDSSGEKITPSLRWVGGSTSQLRAVTGKYDNGQSQFTLVDVQFSSPVTGDSSIFHIYVPVLVKKILPFKMYIAATNGTDYTLDPYDSLRSTVIASHGESVTMRLTYQYLRTKDEWENSINSGENYLWKFDKAISLGGENTSSLPSGTWLGLVDANDGGKMYDFTVENSNSLPGNVLTFSKAFPSWYENQGSYFCERLPLQATENAESGEMVETTAADATVLVNGIYYRPYNETTDTDLIRYHISCTEENQTTGDFDGYVEVSESYFLTLCTPENEQEMIYVHANYASIKGGMPVQKLKAGAKNGTENILVIGNFFAQSKMTVTTSSDTNDKLTDQMPTASGEMEVSVDFSGDTDEEKLENKKLFNDNISAVGALWQQFSMQMKEYDAVGNSKLFTIPWNTLIRVNQMEVSYKDSDGVPQTIIPNTEDYAKDYLVSQENRVSFEALDVLQYLKIGAQGVSVKLYFDVTFSEEGLMQLPKRVSEAGTEGVAIRGLSKISYQKSGLANAAAKDGEGQNHYWSSKDASASLVYESSEYDAGLSNGYKSSLGINAMEDLGAGLITSGFYDMSVLQNVDTANGIHYTLQLLKKESDNTYVAVDLRDYLSELTMDGYVKEADVSDLSSDISAAYNRLVYNEKSKCAELYLDWNGSAHVDDHILNIPVTFDIETGWDGDDTKQYSNYKVLLHVELGTFNDRKTAMSVLQDSGAEDYIIYTNAKIYTGIVPYGSQ